jgi:hypothetical protein
VVTFLAVWWVLAQWVVAGVCADRYLRQWGGPFRGGVAEPVCDNDEPHPSTVIVVQREVLVAGLEATVPVAGDGPCPGPAFPVCSAATVAGPILVTVYLTTLLVRSSCRVFRLVR